MVHLEWTRASKLLAEDGRSDETSGRTQHPLVSVAKTTFDTLASVFSQVAPSSPGVPLYRAIADRS